MSWADYIERYLPLVRDVLHPVTMAVRDDIAGGIQRPCVQSGTGSGKSRLAIAFALAARDAGLRVGIFVPRTRLAQQFSADLKSLGCLHSVLAAELPASWYRMNLPVQLMMWPTLIARVKGGAIPLPQFDVILVDECHLAAAPQVAWLLDQYPEAVIVGLTATPVRTDGKPLKGRFDRLREGPQYLELVDAGALVPMDAYELDEADRVQMLMAEALLDVKADAGGWVENWREHAPGRMTLGFARNKRHGREIVDAFCEAGHPFELLIDADNERARERALGRLVAHKIQGVISCTLLSYGVDVPPVDCIAMYRETESVALWYQSIGRGARAHPGKDRCILLDYGGCMGRLGHPHDERHWSLEAGAVAGPLPPPTKCPTCKVIYRGEYCKRCAGEERVPKTRVTIDVTLKAVVRDDASVASIDPRGFYTQVLGWYQKKWPMRWTVDPVMAHRYAKQATDKKTRGGWQDWDAHALMPCEPSEATRAWLEADLEASQDHAAARVTNPAVAA